MKDKHCHFCGGIHCDSEYPKTCPSCNKMTWCSPLPVVICIQPVIILDHQSKEYPCRKYMIAQRAIEPNIGGWALIGGHINLEETVEEAGIREFTEETGLTPTGVKYVTNFYNDNGHIIFVVSFDPIYEEKYHDAVLCPENLSFGLLDYYDPEDKDLCFSNHKKALDYYKNMD